MLRRLLLTTVLLAGLIAPVSAQAHNVPRRCGNQKNSHDTFAHWGRVRAHGSVHCSLGRRIARYYTKYCYDRGQCGKPARIDAFGGWSCPRKRAGIETSRVRCRELDNRRRVVHFLVGF